MPKSISHSEQQTIKIAKTFAKSLKGGEVVCLIGELGAGKTVFTKGLAQGLGIKKLVRSPSFILMKIYSRPDVRCQGSDVRCQMSGVRCQKSDVRGQMLNVPAKRDQVSNVKCQLCHIDAYRIKYPQEIIDIGALEYFNQLNTISVIEWADKIKKVLPGKRIEIRISFGGKERERRISIYRK